MKKAIRQIGRYLKKFDVSPFSQGGYLKLILYLIWGINAGVFICYDKQTENDYSNEHFRIIECRTDYDHIIIDADNISTPEYHPDIIIGFVFMPEQKGLNHFVTHNLSNRAPPISC